MKNPEIPVALRKPTHADLIKILPDLIPKGMPVVVLSDFDETLCSTYTYDPETKTHWPEMNQHLLDQIQRMTSPIIIATSRAADEMVITTKVSQLVAGKNLPILCENGGVLYFPDSGNTLVLTTDQQIAQLDDLRKLIATMRVTPELAQRELIFRTQRLATIEVRIQDKSGVGTPQFYPELERLVKEQFDTSALDFVSSNNSMSIHAKGINKRSGFQEALKHMGLRREAIFVIGLGDAVNDKPIFEEADLGIAVRPTAQGLSDIFVDGGDQVALSVLTYTP